MVNIVFGDSIAGSIKMADYHAKKNGNIVADLSENLLCYIHNLDYGDILDNGIGEIRIRENNRSDDLFLNMNYTHTLKNCIKIIKNRCYIYMERLGKII